MSLNTNIHDITTFSFSVADRIFKKIQWYYTVFTMWRIFLFTYVISYEILLYVFMVHCYPSLHLAVSFYNNLFFFFQAGKFLESSYVRLRVWFKPTSSIDRQLENKIKFDPWEMTKNWVLKCTVFRKVNNISFIEQ